MDGFSQIRYTDGCTMNMLLSRWPCDNGEERSSGKRETNDGKMVFERKGNESETNWKMKWSVKGVEKQNANKRKKKTKESNWSLEMLNKD